MTNSISAPLVALSGLRAGPLGPWLPSFALRLAALGYRPSTSRQHVALVACLGRWMAERRMVAGALDESVIDRYIKRRRQARRGHRPAAALLFLDHLRVEGWIAPRKPLPDLSPVALHCSRYAEYLRKERGASDRTVEDYVLTVREFLVHRFAARRIEFEALTAAQIASYLIARSRTQSSKRVQFLATSLRSFFRFLFARGETSSDLSTCVPTVRTTYPGSVPRYLPAADVEKLLHACDPATAVGRRDRAILLLLARLGLRASEVAALDLEDIRWRSGEIVVRGKGDVIDRLPLLPDVGQALALYLRKDRPKTASRRVFLRLRAPIRGLCRMGTIRTVVHSALGKAGLYPRTRGAHLLRHSLGTRMIRAGASLSEIGEVLRHHSPRSAEIYAKVDFEALRCLAQSWPRAGGAQ